MASDLDHVGPHGECAKLRSVKGCSCPEPELVVTSGISINLFSHKIDHEQLTMDRRCACCSGHLPYAKTE